MLGPLDIAFLLVAAALVICGSIRRLKLYRSLIWGSAVLATITALYPRPGNGLASILFGGTVTVPRLPSEVFGIAWWILGAWLVRGLLQLILRRTIFPNDNQPHARRLFADLASGFVYVVAFVGIMDTVLKQPISTLLATSGVLAIVLGLALQNTLADVFSGLAINVERPFGAGDWITITGDVEGQVIEINWRATRIRTLSNDIIVIPNSVVAKAVVTNHRPLNQPNFCTIEIRIDHSVTPSRVIDALQAAASVASDTIPASPATAYASAFADTLIVYQLSFAVNEFYRTSIVRSDVISRVAEAMSRLDIQIGTPVMDVRIVRDARLAANGDRVRTGGPLEPVRTSKTAQI
jgi:small-conductance mechanosensitive channel